MLVEFSIEPLGVDAHIGDEIAEALKLVDASGLPYQLTPAGTCIEGDWDEVLSVIRQCHERLRKTSPHVITWIKIEDDEDDENQLAHNVASVEQKVGHELKREGLLEKETASILEELVET